ncbi:MAG: excinuclease ABC subunit UvrC [Bacteroidota bacterium]
MQEGKGHNTEKEQAVNVPGNTLLPEHSDEINRNTGSEDDPAFNHDEEIFEEDTDAEFPGITGPRSDYSTGIGEDTLKDKISRLPDSPGIYRFFDQEGTIIYVGKAKSLRKRVSSYFLNKAGLDRKTARLVQQIRNLQTTVVDTEFDALLLENSLIKEHQPRYNILLKDDKSYPFVLVTAERFPRIFPTRRLVKGAGTYIGPYASGRTMHTVLELLKKLYTFRTCTLNLTEENVSAGKFKVCLEYHIGNCKGPCQNLQSEADYQNEADQAMAILKGQLSKAKAEFRTQMSDFASVYEYEKAQKAKEKLDLLDNYQAKSVIVMPDLPDTDVFTIISDEKCAWMNYLRLSFGSVTLIHSFAFKKKLEETEEELLEIAIVEMRMQFRSDCKEVLTNIPVSLKIPGVNMAVPVIGDKKRLLDLSIKNALYYKKEQMTRVEEQKPKEARFERVLKQMQKDLRMKEMPLHIECFDNSNIQGTNPVAGMVCFKNGVPSKKDYRHFNIKTVIGPDDFASMDEVVTRRYSRLLDENQPLPQLIIIDGGKGQLSAAVEALRRLDLYGKITVIGIAKRLEELYYPGDSHPLYLDKKSESLMLIQRIRNEVHRFAITFHRDQRSKSALKGSTEEVKGLGQKTMDKVYTRFKALKKITDADRPELEKLVGKSKAGLVMDYLTELRKGKKQD